MPDRNVPAPIVSLVAIRLTVDQRRATITVLERSRHRHSVTVLGLPHGGELFAML